MYLDVSIRKLVVLSTIVICMLIAVVSTMVTKQVVFGATPYFYSSTVGTQYVFNSLLASLERLGARGLHALGVGEPPARPDTKASSVPVLTYHRLVGDENDFNNVTVEHFRDQMEKLYAAGWQTVSLADFESFIRGEKELPEKSFLLTFDDGAKESFYPADPILRALGFRATMFIIENSANVAQKGSTYYLSPEEIERMLRTGRWDIGSHSFDGHRPYTVDSSGTSGIFFADRLWKAGEARLETPEEFTARVHDDLQKAKDEQEQDYGVPIKSFAFPLGNETGINGSGNFAEGSSITEREARSVYEFGYLQLENQHYTFNFAKNTQSFEAGMDATTTVHLSDGFLIRRIHVDYDWDGERLLSIMENGRAKALPYEDDFTNNRGWIASWGLLDFGRNNFVIKAEPNDTSASAFLDGSALWKAYSFDVAINWQKGWLFLLADVVDSGTYHLCGFSPGVVRIQSTVHGVTHLLKEVRDPRITHGDNIRYGIRVHDDVIECTQNFQSIAEVYTRDFSGGVGIQTWEENPGSASVQVISAIARPYESPAASGGQ